MNARFVILLWSCLMLGLPPAAAAEKKLFRFGVVTQPTKMQAEHRRVEELLAALDAEQLAFIVANGIKAADEPCTDELYSERKALFDSATNALIPSLTANDWTGCLKTGGKSAAVERLSRVREVFFSENASFGESKIPLMRQSITPQFRTYSENARWRYRNILFATLHLPANNNNFIVQAGRNSEFEDRLIANRDWLQKLLILAKRKKIDGLVLFCDGNPLAVPVREEMAAGKAERDGFLETRQQILKLASKFSGKVLIIHNQAKSRTPSTGKIRWSRNLGDLGVAAGYTDIWVTTGPMLFALGRAEEKRHSPADSRR